MKNADRSGRLFVFSDLDGTLLDHNSYSWEPASPALIQLKKMDASLILASSKTAAEMAPLRNAMGFSHCPAIVENGAGVLQAGETESDAHTQYAELLERIGQVSSDLLSEFRGFSQSTDQQIADKTGLSLIEAKLARIRQFSEPGEWLGTDEALLQFKHALSKLGVKTSQGGRFLSLSFGGNKAEQLEKIMAVAMREGPCLSIAFGDAPNDIAMIEQADYGVIINNPSHAGIGQLEGESTGRIFRSGKIGPDGWNEMIFVLLEKLGLGVRNG